MIPKSLYAFAIALVVCSLTVECINYDTGINWYQNFASKNCSGGKPPLTKPLPVCPDSDVTVEDAQALGWKFAPILYQHGLEWSFLTDPEKWLNNSRVFDTIDFREVPYPESVSTSFEYTSLLGPHSYASHIINDSFMLVNYTAMREDIIGDGVGPNNTLLGKIWYTVFDNDGINVTAKNNALVFTYNLFYPFQGCINEALVTAFDDKYQGAEFYLCPKDSREGDWEHVTVYVCKSDLYSENTTNAIKRIQYSQHDWLPEYDCETGECTFEMGDDGLMHPVSHAALFSHANFPEVSPFIVYDMIRFDFLQAFDGLYYGDRTNNTYRFMPSSSNVQLLPYNTTMPWVQYLGGWGTLVTTAGRVNDRSVTCLYDNVTQQGPCNETNPAYATYLEYGGTLKTDPSQLTWEKVTPTKGELPPGLLQGPLSQAYNFFYQYQIPPPVINATCPMSVNRVVNDNGLFTVTVTSNTTGGVYLDGTDPELVRFIMGVALFVCLTGLILGVLLFLPLVYVRKAPKTPGPVCEGNKNSTMKSSLSMEKEPEAPKEKKIFIMSKHRIWMLVATAMYIPGIVLSLIGISGVFDALDMVYSASFWNVLNNALLGVCIVFGVIGALQLILAIATRIFARESLFGATYGYKAMHKRKSGWSERHGWKLSAVMCCLLLIEMNVTMGLFCIGVVAVVVRAVIIMACNAVYDLLIEATGSGNTDVCIDFKVLGNNFAKICGTNIGYFCNAWIDTRATFVVWGSFLFLTSEVIYLILAHTTLIELQLATKLRDGPADDDIHDKEKEEKLIVNDNGGSSA